MIIDLIIMKKIRAMIINLMKKMRKDGHQDGTTSKYSGGQRNPRNRED
jgi:hypothetical protein